MTDIRDAVRALRATPLVTAVAVLSLALGIGANTAMFSIVDALILRSLPVRHAERLATLVDADGSVAWTNPIWEAIRAREGLFDGAFASSPTGFDLATGGEIDPVDGLWASGGMFETLGVEPILGRTFTAADDRRGGGPDGAVAVISYGFWQRRFGGSADVIGRRITLNGIPVTIIGVTPSTFFGPDVGRTFDVAVPLGLHSSISGNPRQLDSRSSWWLNVMVRLAPGQSAQQATEMLRAMQPAIAEETRPADLRPEEAARHLADPVALQPAASGASDLRSRYQRPVVTLFVVVGLVLLIACGNIANLQLARATARRHELSVRTALGASAARIARQLLTESLLLSSIGGILGVAIAWWGSRLIVSQLSTATDRVFLDVGIDWRMLGFTAGMAISTALLFGIVPALRAARVAPIDAMKEHGRGTSSGRRVGLAGALVMAQVALSLVLLMGAGLFVRTLASLANQELGFDRDRALVVTIRAQRAGVDSAARLAMYQRVREAVLALPGVSQAALAEVAPLSGENSTRRMLFPGRPEQPESERRVHLNYISPGWFATFGTPLVAGRDFDARDRTGAPRAVIVNQDFVRKYFDGEVPVGRFITESPTPTADLDPLEIVGVVGDAVYRSQRAGVPATMYWPIAQRRNPPPTVFLTVRVTNGDPATLMQGVAAAVTRVNPALSLSFRSISSMVSSAMAQERLVALLSGFFGALALLLAALGLYGITAYAVSRRQIELGIRMAVGASPAGIVRLVLGRVVLLVGGGILIGVTASWWMSKFIEALLFGLTPRDPATMMAAVGVLATIGILAGLLPARRAAGIDPAQVLRDG